MDKIDSRDFTEAVEDPRAKEYFKTHKSVVARASRRGNK